MNTTQAALVRLQEIDIDLLRSKRRIESLPQQQTITQLRRAIKRVNAESAHLLGLRKDLEMSLMANEETYFAVSAEMDEAQEKVDTGTQDFRAIRDLSNKLSSLATQLERLEFDRGRMNAELAEINAKESEYKEWLARAKTAENSALASFKNEVASIGAHVEVLRRERSELTAGLAPDVVAKYNKVAQRFDGLAVEVLRGNTPSVCRVCLQPSQYVTLHTSEGFCECPYCHRILIVGEQ